MSKRPPLNKKQSPESIKNELRAEVQELIDTSLQDFFEADNDFSTIADSEGGEEEEPTPGNLLDLYFRKDAEDKDSEYIPAENPDNGEIRAFGRLTEPDGQGKIFVNVPAKIISKIKRIDYWTVRLSGQEPFRTEKAFFVFKGLNPNKTYRAIVRGFNQDGKEIGKSQPITFKTIPKTTPPDNPDALSLDANFGGQDLVVRWTYSNPKSDFKVFKIRYSNVQDGETDPPYIETDISGNKNVFTFEENKKYFGVPSPKIRVNVKAKDTSGNESSGIFVVATNEAPTNSPTLSYKDGNNKSNPNGYTLILNTQNAPRDLQKIQIFEWTASSGGTATLVKTINRKKIENDDDDITEVQITKRGQWTQTWVSARYVDVFNQKGSQSARLTVNNNWQAGNPVSGGSFMDYDGSRLLLNNSQLLVGNSSSYISINYNNNNRIIGVNNNRIKFILNANTGNASFAGKIRQGARLGQSNINVNEFQPSPGPSGVTGSYVSGGTTITLSSMPTKPDPDGEGLTVPAIEEGMIVTGEGIKELTRIVSISGLALTINKTVTLSQTNAPLSFPRDPYQGLNVNDRVIISDNVNDGSILFLGNPQAFDATKLPRSIAPGTKGTTGLTDIITVPVIGEIYDASLNPQSFSSGDEGTSAGYGIAVGGRENSPNIEVGYVTTSGSPLPRIRLLADDQTLDDSAAQYKGPVLTLGIGPSHKSFRIFGGNASRIDGFANDTTATKLLGKNADGFLRWYDPGEGGGTGKTYTSGDNDAGIIVNNTENTITNAGYRMQGTTTGGWTVSPRLSPRNRITFGSSLPNANINDGDIHIEF